MGSFAGLYKAPGCRVTENKRAEFVRRMEKLFQAAGMMEVEVIQLYGEQIELLRKPAMHDYGIDVYYNYFEDSRWENAGFSSETYSVWSEKVGGLGFRRAVMAAYVLEELYTEGICATTLDGEVLTTWIYVGWINYLFDEKYHLKNFDPWKLFEARHISNETGYRRDWFDFGDARYAFIGGCETCAVERGAESALQHYEQREKGALEQFALDGMRMGREAVYEYARLSQVDRDLQLTELMGLLCGYYRMTDEELKSFKLLPDESHPAESAEEAGRKMLLALRRSDAPAFLVKVISEVYECDFWALWANIKDIAERKMSLLYGNEGYFVVPVPTAEVFDVSEDDLIPYWEEGCRITFSEELWGWFGTLKARIDALTSEELQIESPLRYIVGLLKEAEEEYGRIYAFAEFFEESIENLKSERYLAFWKVFEELLHDPELKSAADVIFVPDGPEYAHMGVHSWGKEPKRRLIRNWDWIDTDKRKNKGRITLRRYLALLANRTLREKVFGGIA